MTLQELQNKIQNAKPLDFGTIFNQSIELFKKVWVQGFIVLLLTMLIAVPFFLVIYIPLIVFGSIDSMEPNVFSDMEPFAAVLFAILYLVVITAVNAIAFGFKAAFYRICKHKDLDIMAKEDYFYFFKGPYLLKTIKLALAAMGIAIIAMLLCVLPIIYVSVPIYLMVVIYAFNPELSVSDIVKASFDLGNKKWLITFGLAIVTSFLAGIVGMLMCFVGVYITASFGYLCHYFIYKDVIGFDDENNALPIENLN